MDNDCCTYQCEQGKNCPVRATRRVRAGQPAPPILLDPADTADEKDELPTWISALIVVMLAGVVGFMAFAWVVAL
jgi:hypothetical protein